MKLNDLTPNSSQAGGTLTPAFYLQLLQHFVETGSYEAALPYREDALTAYLIETMADPVITAQVLSDEVSARVFLDTHIQFVALCLKKAQYRLQRTTAERHQIKEAEQWSLSKREAGWRALLAQVDEEYGEDGFERAFFEQELNTEEGGVADNGKWTYFLNEWERLLRARMESEKHHFVNERKTMEQRLLQTNLRAVASYIQNHQIGNEDFYQTWALMGGRWNSLEFERLQQVARLQRKYPLLMEVVKTMGRKADPLGNKHIGTTSGRSETMEHASRSDINGITMGRNLNALLPTEWAHYLDAELEDVFLQKYVTGQLQTFEYQSNQLHATRSLHQRRARPQGPMIVCVDRSGSMMGEPEKVALSLLMRLTEWCQKTRRDCYLIGFAVRTLPVDVMEDRAALLRFFQQRATGGTDARCMMDQTFELINSHPRYRGADVLWITDFRIPLPPASYFAEMERLQQADTRFYGLQLGVAENHWTKYFDRIFQLNDIRMAVV